MTNLPEGVVYNDGFQVITWNEGATFNVWFQFEEGAEYRNVDCFTVYGVKDEQQAREIAQEHADENNELIGE